MTQMTLTALYDARTDADQAAERLAGEIGIPRSDITVTVQDEGSTQGTGFLATLKGMFMPDDDRHTYSEAVRRGGFLLTARADEGSAERTMDILEQQGAVDLDDRQRSWGAEGSIGQHGPSSGAQTLSGGTLVTDASGTSTPQPMLATSPAAARPIGAGEEETIALTEEQIRIGKRAVQGGRVRVRSYTVETPIEEQVNLREERVVIEHRKVDRDPTPADEVLFAGRTVEMTETAEEAVVSKTAHVTEEVVVSKDSDERVEKVRDTVRHTEVEVDDTRATDDGMAARPLTAGMAPSGKPSAVADTSPTPKPRR